MRLKVLHIINSLEIGGAEMLLANVLSPGGLQQYCDNTLIYFGGNGELRGRIDPTIEIINLNYTGLIQLPGLLQRIKKIVKEKKIDLVHSHLNPAGVYIRIALPATMPQLHTLHTCYSQDTETRPVMRWLERRKLFNHPQVRLIFLSEYLRKDFLEQVAYRGKSYILPNSIGDAFFQLGTTAPQKDGTLKLVAVGNLKEVKNYPFLFKVLEQLKDQPVSLDIYGEGAEKEKYKAMVDRSGIAVRFRGHSDQLSEVYKNYDLFIMASRFEGYPLSVVEAMASGLPVMVSDIPSLRDLVKDMGLFFNLNDTQQAVQLLQNVLGNRNSLDQLRLKGLKYAKEIGQRSHYLQSLISIYRDVVQVEAVANEVYGHHSDKSAIS